MTASRVDYTKLFSESWNNVYQLIKSVSNVADPISVSTQFRKWVYSREPDVKANDFSGYPFVIVHPAEFSQEDEGQSLDGKSQMTTWDVEIEIVSSDRGFGPNDGKGRTYLDAVSNDVVQTLNDATNRATLRSNGMYFSKSVSGGSSVDALSNELVFRRSIMVGFRGKLQVSA